MNAVKRDKINIKCDIHNIFSKCVFTE